MDALPDSRFLYLTEIGEPEDNWLRVVVEAAPDPGPAGGQDAGARQIVPAEPSAAFELSWRTYVSYAVLNESYATPEAGETIGEGPLVERSKSRFLDYVAQATFASDSYPGRLRHWSLFTLNHVLEVVGTEAPVVRPLAPGEPRRGPTNVNWRR